MSSLHTYAYTVSFGDCDPAGIAYYPNIFKWVDTAFHAWLFGFGGHGALCEQLGATGLGLMDSKARFRSPLQNGDALTVTITALEWGKRTLSPSYQGHVGDRLAFEAQETRGVFIPQDGRLTAGTTDGLRTLIQSYD